MKWPWSKRETRDSSYTDTLIQTILSTATGASIATPTATGALESAAGLVARSFAGATVQAPASMALAISPAFLSLVGRSLIRYGELAVYVHVRNGTLRLTPAASHDVKGDSDPETWTYELHLAGPSRYWSVDHVPAESVLHFRYQVDPGRPWRGIGPIESASLAGKLSSATISALADEAGGPRGQLLPIPVDGQDPTVASLKADIRTLAGKLAIVESAGAAGWGDADGGKGATGWDPKRIGADPPAAMVQLLEAARLEVLSACGVPPSLFLDSDGTGQRESFRRFLHTTLQPLARIVERELSDKLEADVRLNLDGLFAADLSGRARAFQSLVGGGMDLAKAAGLAGVMESE